MEPKRFFCVNHDYLSPGMYISRIAGTVTTFDLRFRKPNSGQYLDNMTIHSIEHMFDTYIRNDEAVGDCVLHFGPMGCQTGFHLLLDKSDAQAAYDAVIRTLNKIIEHTGSVFGATRQECGNYYNLSLSAAKQECTRYLRVLAAQEDRTLSYSEEARAL